MKVALLAAFILERHSKLGSVGDRVPVADVEILLDHLGNSELPQTLPSEFTAPAAASSQDSVLMPINSITL